MLFPNQSDFRILDRKKHLKKVKNYNPSPSMIIFKNNNKKRSEKTFICKK